jgi:hypothetical protein
MNLRKVYPRSVWIGFDPREVDAYAVARSSIRRHTLAPIPVSPVELDSLRARGLYRRPTERRDGRLWDVISDAPMATEFACSRFLVPHLAGSGWALFMDCDMLVRTNISRLFEICDPTKAVMVVKHHHEPPEGEKMDGQIQTRYARKNWSSVMAFNCDHPANKALTVDMVNTFPGRDLHRFCWLEDHMIGELTPSWNWLAYHSSPEIDPDIVHFTEGLPSMLGYEDQPYADEWRRELLAWAA